MNALQAFVAMALLLIPSIVAAAETKMLDIGADVLADKIRGGLVGQILGNLNGLPHEMKYIDEPGKVERYTPALPEGARTDDDTDIEWVYVVAIERANRFYLNPAEIVDLWKRHINTGIWSANNYARQLMDLGIEPPLTGRPAINTWSEFNISGQFVAEVFGLMAPAMPQSAGRLGLHYTHVSIDGEPAQATQLIDAMIAEAFREDDVPRIIASAAAALDPESRQAKIVRDVRAWHAEHPGDWQATRRLIRDTHSRYGGKFPDPNGCDLNTAAIIAALLYGDGDFVKTMIMAFNFGWDADCNAATAGTVVGVIKGYRWMEQQGWTIKDTYRNTVRPGMPDDETISRYAERITRLAERMILERGGLKVETNGLTVYRIVTETPGNVEPLRREQDEFERLQTQLRPQIERDFSSDDALAQARAAYLAICLDVDGPLREKHADRWDRALTALQSHAGLMKVIFDSKIPTAVRLRERAEAAGLKRPPRAAG